MSKVEEPVSAEAGKQVLAMSFKNMALGHNVLANCEPGGTL